VTRTEQTLRRYAPAAFAIMFAFAAMAPNAIAEEAAADAAAEIRQALTQWTDDFNAGRTDKICDLFAADVRADIRGAPERDHAAICDLLVRSLKDESKHYTYAMGHQRDLGVGRCGGGALGVDAHHRAERRRQHRIDRAGHGYFPKAGRRQLADHPLHGL
jgi:hypothetical protein